MRRLEPTPPKLPVQNAPLVASLLRTSFPRTAELWERSFSFVVRQAVTVVAYDYARQTVDVILPKLDANLFSISIKPVPHQFRYCRQRTIDPRQGLEVVRLNLQL